MNTLYTWAANWRVPVEALRDLQQRLVATSVTETVRPSRSEAAVQQQVRLEAAEKRILLFRNNVGVLMDRSEPPRPVRFGLCNDSKQLNERFKSGDLIGLRPNGQFVSREIKAEGWYYTDTEHERAQLAWITLIQSHGGDAAFATGRGTL